jgi:hypothetical protein
VTDLRFSAKSFWHYFFSALQSPVNKGLTADGKHFINGFIVLGIYVLITSFSTYLHTVLVSSQYQTFGNQIKMFFSAFIFPLISTAIFLVILLGILFLVARLMGSNADFPDVTARFGALMALPVAFNFIQFFITILNANGTLIDFFVSLLATISLLTAITFLIYSFRGSGIDPFYGVILTFVAIGVLLLIFKDAIFQGMFSSLY